MTTPEFEAPDLKAFLEHLYPGLSPEQLASMVAGDRELIDPFHPPEPELHPIPDVVRGFRVRLDLQHTSPPVWRRLELPGDLTLPRLHDVIQAAMGWTDSHLHRFRTGNGYNAPAFLTPIDLDEGDEGTPEEGIRLDQIVAEKDDRLWYDYDFGDGWEHVLRVEKVLDEPPATPICVTGKLACPPEDCGGISGHDELSRWVRGGKTDELLPGVFESTEHALAWVPDGWHPDAFDLDDVNLKLAVAVAEPIPVVAELGSLLDLSARSGSRTLRHALAHPSAAGPTTIDDDALAEMTAPIRAFLRELGDGATLTSAGYLPPALVRQIAHAAGIMTWWFGRTNREEAARPVAYLRATMRTLGLVSVRKGRIAPTAAIRGKADDPRAIIRHLIARLPLGTDQFDRHAGWMTLVSAATDAPAELWRPQASDLLADIGWRSADGYELPPSGNPTLDVLDILAGLPHGRWHATGAQPAIAALARAVIQA